MCVVVQRHLAKGSRCAPLLDTPGHWPSIGIEPIAGQQNVQPFYHWSG